MSFHEFIFMFIILCYFYSTSHWGVIDKNAKKVRSLVVSNLCLETKGSQFELRSLLQVVSSLQ